MSSDRKKWYMWLCVIGTASIIGLIWIASLKYNISTAIISLKNKKNDNWDALKNLGNDLGENYKGVKNFFDQNITATSTADGNLKN